MRILWASAIALAAASVAACDELGLGQGEQAAEKPLNIYNWSDYIGETTLADFTTATGIKTNYDTYDSNDVLDAKLLAGKSGYDLVVPTAQPYFARQVASGTYQKLDRSKIPNWGNQDTRLLGMVAAADPGNEHGAIYQWGTNGVGYNVKMIAERMADAPVTSLRMLFDAEIVAKFADCGVTMLDSATEILPIALHYLGKNPNSDDPADLAAAEELMLKVRPHIKYFHSSQYINDLANGDVCLVLGWSGDVIQAQARASEAGNGQEIAYAIPEEGTILWFDMLAIPTDAPNPDAAHAFINFVLDPPVMAGITNYVAYGNPVPASLPLIDEAIRNDPTIFPPPEVQDRLFVVTSKTQEAERALTDTWRRVRTGN